MELLKKDLHATFEPGTDKNSILKHHAVMLYLETCYKELAFVHEALLLWIDTFPNIYLLKQALDWVRRLNIVSDCLAPDVLDENLKRVIIFIHCGQYIIILVDSSRACDNRGAGDKRVTGDINGLEC